MPRRRHAYIHGSARQPDVEEVNQGVQGNALQSLWLDWAVFWRVSIFITSNELPGRWVLFWGSAVIGKTLRKL